jgi:hypothetical protein
MLRLLKKCGWVLLLGVMVQSGWGFAILGTREPYQIDSLGYIADFSFQPHNIGEEYRVNIPQLFYTYDAAFLDYFGSNGVQAVDAAASLLNGILSTNTSAWSSDLSEWPLQADQVNYLASALHLQDLRSCAIEVLLEHLGLGDPERFNWTLRVRVLPPGASCPAYIYEVIKRNFDPITWTASSYVNGNLYTYTILEFCPGLDQAIAAPVLVDPDATASSAVATPKISLNNPFYYGYFHTTLTRDDVGGLRYLYRPTNVNLESSGSNTLTFVTNQLAQLFFTSNLTLFADQALTNTPAALQAIYPDLVISSSSNFFVNVYTTNAVPYFTNSPWAPVGSPPELKFATNITLNLQTYFRNTYANLLQVVFTNGAWRTIQVQDIFPLTNRAVISIQTSYTTNSPFAPFGTTQLTTNTVVRNFITNEIAGEFLLLPTNLCDVAILATQATFTNSFTNLNFLITNTITFSNALTGTSTNVTEFIFQNEVDFATNHAFVAFPVTCPGSNPGLLEGVDRVRFVRRDFDSLLSRFWSPITNTYSVVAITNNIAYPQTITRVVTQPDFIFSAGDNVTGPTTIPIIIPTVARPIPRWNTLNTDPDVFGPGTIEVAPPGTLDAFEFDKVGPIYQNIGPFFLDQVSADLVFIWGSFDGTTNPPVVYPVGSSITNLENQLVIQLTALNLISGQPLGTTNTFYAPANSAFQVQLQAAGGQPPYTWSLAPTSPAMPPDFSPPDANGVISGNPTSNDVGTYDIIVRLIDAGGRVVDRPYIIIVTP